MKIELQNLVARYKNIKRDKNGRFVGGSGGIRFPKDFNWRRALPVILVVALVGGYLVWQSFAATSVTPPNWKLYWSDEFNTSSLDTSRWGAYHNTYGDGNKEEACLTPSNVTSSNGTLKITSKKEPITCPGATQDQFSSGFIGSRDAPAKVYYPAFARYEIRAKVPHAQGLWPAFWLRTLVVLVLLKLMLWNIFTLKFLARLPKLCTYLKKLAVILQRSRVHLRQLVLVLAIGTLQSRYCTV
jgi:hypothetical protein